MQGAAWHWCQASHRALDSKLESALAKIHAAGILHGDLHDGNILVTPDDQVFILDFAAAEQHATRKALRLEKEDLATDLGLEGMLTLYCHQSSCCTAQVPGTCEHLPMA